VRKFENDSSHSLIGDSPLTLGTPKLACISSIWEMYWSMI
jgi:hypothetical protein